MKQTLKKVLPPRALAAVRSARNAVQTRCGSGLTTAEVFSDIYAKNTRGPKSEIWSGWGIHNPSVVDPYVAAVRRRRSELYPDGDLSR